jgi:hypothetical protein
LYLLGGQKNIAFNFQLDKRTHGDYFVYTPAGKEYRRAGTENSFHFSFKSELKMASNMNVVMGGKGTRRPSGARPGRQ